MKKSILLACILLTGLTQAQQQQQQRRITRTAEKAETVIDTRNNEKYETVRYTVTYPDNSQIAFTWMSRNLNYNMEGSYAYQDNEEHSKTYGRLYTWDAANNACPSGWHLPSDEEWYLLAFHYGGNCSSGKHLKSTSELWKRKESRGSNKSLFNALPSGLGSRKGTYHRLGWVALFWSSNERDKARAWDWKLTGGNELQRWIGSKKARNSVRCVKDTTH